MKIRFYANLRTIADNATLDILDSSIQEVVQQLKIFEEIKGSYKEESYEEIYPK